MAINLKHRHAPVMIIAGVVLASMIMCSQGNIHRWVADIIMVFDSIALVVIALWCGFTEVMRHYG